MRSLLQYSRWALAAMVVPAITFADEAVGGGGSSGSALMAIAAAVGIAIAAFGGAAGQGKIAAAFMDGASRNPQAVNQMRTPMILSLVFVETLVLLTFVIAIMLVGKV